MQLDHNEIEVAEAMERLESNRYLSDEEYAKRRIVQLLHKGNSKSLLKKTLQREGISLSSEEISNAAIEENAPDEIEKILELCKRKFDRKIAEVDLSTMQGRQDWYKLKGKISYFLFRHGFGQDQCEQVMRLLAKS